MTAPAPAAPAVLHRPRTLDEALGLLAAGDAVPLGGGVAHTLRRHDGRPPRAAALVAVAGLPELRAITWAGDHVTIGAGVPLVRCAADRRLAGVWPAVTEACASVATDRIRRLVTLGGNIAACDDSHDPPVALTAAGATLTVRAAGSTRTLPVDQAHRLAEGELVQDVRLPLPTGAVGSAFEKFLVRGVWEYACVNVAAVVELGGDGTAVRLCLAVGSVTGGPVAVDLGDLRGAAVGGALIEEAARRASATTRPYGDVRGSAPYKSHMIAEFTRRALTTAAGRARHRTEAR
jgi:aerobic carbon-monoxide dehydrogenase medium subunit